MKKSIKVKGIKNLEKVKMQKTKAGVCSKTFDDGSIICTSSFTQVDSVIRELGNTVIGKNYTCYE